MSQPHLGVYVAKPRRNSRWVGLHENRTHLMQNRMFSRLGLTVVAVSFCCSAHGSTPTPILLLTNAPVEYIYDAPKGQPVSFVGIIGRQEPIPYGSNYHGFAVSVHTEKGFRAYSIWLSRPVSECCTQECVAAVSGILKDGQIGIYTMDATNVVLRGNSPSYELSGLDRSRCEQCITDAWPRLIAIKPEALSRTPGFSVSPSSPHQFVVKTRDFERGVTLVNGGCLFSVRRQPAFKTDIYAEHIWYDLVFDERTRTVKAIWIYLITERGPPD